jgi:hypothetical protein
MKVRADKRRLISLFGHRGADGPAKVGQVVRDEVGQVRILGVVPDLLGRIEVWGIGRQPFRLEPVRPAFQEDADRLPVDVPAVQNDDEPPRQMAVESEQKRHHLGRTDVVGMKAEVQAHPASHGRDRDHRHGRQPGKAGHHNGC